MKKIVLSLFALFFSLGINAQEYNSEKGHYSKVIQAEGQSIQEINQKVNEWIALNYKSAQDVIQLNSESKIVMKAIQSIPTQMYGMAYSFYVNNTVTISIREGRFKVDYEFLKERIRFYKEELIQKCFHPTRLVRYLETYNYNIGEDEYED